MNVMKPFAFGLELITFLMFLAVVARPSSISAQSIADVPRLQVHTADGQTTFRIGERIPLQLSFTGPDPKRFEITNGHSRSGRNSYEDFEISPDQGWVDPLTSYFSRGHFGGGVSSANALSANPVVFSIDLNEWVRFDQPGVYRVVVISHRVSDVTAPDPGSLFGHGQVIELKSNPIELHLVAAGKAWQKAQLAAIMGALKEMNSPVAATPAQRAVISSLRYLGTQEAARVMARHLREDEPEMQTQCAFGLIGLPDAVRPAALEALRSMIQDPDFPITGWFLSTYSMLPIDGQESDGALVMKEGAEIESQALKLVVNALLTKRGAARTATAQAIQARPQLTPQMQAVVADVLRSGLAEMPIDRQSAELEYGWDKIRSRDLLPVLKQDAEMVADNPRVKGQIYQLRDLKRAAFRRWYELDPAAAHESLMSQIGSANPTLGPESLAFLPEEKLPQFEHIWASSFVAATDDDLETRLAALMTRFGTGSEVPLVRDKANSRVGEWACAPLGAALAYLAKFDPPSARALVDRALAERGPGKTACYHSIFQDIARWTSESNLTEAAISTLNDPDPQVINDGLIYLMSYGDESAKKPIWDRYVMWSNRWRGREDVLEKREAGSSEDWAEIGLGENLGRALIASQGWLADDALVSRVLELCVVERVCDQLRHITHRSDGPFGVSVDQFGTTQNFQVAQYTAKSLQLLEAKIAQFPRGSRFLLARLSGTDDQKRLEDQVEALFEKHGMILQKQ